MVLLQTIATWGGIDQLVNEIDVSNYTEPEVSQVITKQQSVYPGSYCRIKRRPDPAEIEKTMLRHVDKMIKHESNRKEEK